MEYLEQLNSIAEEKSYYNDGKINVESEEYGKTTLREFFYEFSGEGVKHYTINQETLFNWALTDGDEIIELFCNQTAAEKEREEVYYGEELYKVEKVRLWTVSEEEDGGKEEYYGHFTDKREAEIFHYNLIKRDYENKADSGRIVPFYTELSKTVRELRDMFFHNNSLFAVLFADELTNEEVIRELFEMENQDGRLNYRIDSNDEDCVLIWR